MKLFNNDFKNGGIKFLISLKKFALYSNSGILIANKIKYLKYKLALPCIKYSVRAFCISKKTLWRKVS